MQDSQQGRTLIETISILFVMGIFSVSGLHLYAKAMNSLKINYLMRQVFIRANELVESPVAIRRKVVDIHITEDKLSYGFRFVDSVHNEHSQKMVIQVDGYFSFGMCNMLKEKIKTHEYPGLNTILANGKDLKRFECPEETQIDSVKFFINDDFKEK